VVEHRESADRLVRGGLEGIDTGASAGTGAGVGTATGSACGFFSGLAGAYNSLS
jgi:hypothetical protein